MAHVNGSAKTCQRCGRSGSHAFRRTSDGLYECTTTTACRARARRNAGQTHDGRGRIPSQRGLGGAGLGVAYVVGPDDDDRAMIVASLRDMTELPVVCGTPDRATLAALASRNVRLIAVAAGCLDAIGFRNEFSLRRRQPRLSAVPVLIYGRRGHVDSAATRIPDAAQVGYDGQAELGMQLRRQIEVLEPADP